MIAKYGAICMGVIAAISCIACHSGQNATAVSQIREGDRLTSFSQEITSPINQFQVKAGGTYTLDINVKNTGSQPWFGGKQPMSVDVGYRWVDADGKLVPMEGNRAALDRPVLHPGESDGLKLQVLAPPNPGPYTLWISMVQEGVAWFFDKGTKPLTVQVTVE